MASEEELLEMQQRQQLEMDGLREPSPGDGVTPEYIREVLLTEDVERPGEFMAVLEPLLMRGHAMSNLKDEEVWEDKFLTFNDFEQLKATLPHPESLFTNPVFVKFIGGFMEKNGVAAPERGLDLRMFRRVAVKLAARARSGWQQDKFSDVTRVSRVEGDDRDGKKRSGLLGKLLG